MTTQPNMNQMLWDRRFLSLAEQVATWSKDPSTQTGSIIVDSQRRVVSLGYNGFPRGIQDTPDRLNNRETKYSLVVHAEMNAVLNSTQDLTGCTVYIHPFMPCDRCAVHLIQSGISRVVTLQAPADKLERWSAAFEVTQAILEEANVSLSVYPNRGADL